MVFQYFEELTETFAYIPKLSASSPYIKTFAYIPKLSASSPYIKDIFKT